MMKWNNNNNNSTHMRTTTTTTIIIKLFIYLHSELNSQWPIIEPTRIQTTAIRQHRVKQTKITETKIDQLRLFILTNKLLKISVHLQIASAAKTNLAEGQCLERQLNMVKVLTYVLNRNMNDDCFKGRGAIFSAIKGIYNNARIKVMMSDMQCLKI
jgi:hypothetical protein